MEQIVLLAFFSVLAGGAFLKFAIASHRVSSDSQGSSPAVIPKPVISPKSAPINVSKNVAGSGTPPDISAFSLPSDQSGIGTLPIRTQRAAAAVGDFVHE